MITPSHPGFGGTVRPESLDSVPALARLYAELLESLDLHDVIVVGNSIGGWIAAELALLHPARVSGFVLADGVGIVVDGHPVADFFSLTLPEVAQLSYFEPDKFRIDPSTMPPAAQAAMAGNRQSLATYAGTAMADPTLLGRLGEVTTPTLVVWGEADRIADVDYGRALAAAIPGARFELLKGTGHVPQVETPELLLGTVWEFASALRV